jgi:hypothetical protein
MVNGLRACIRLWLKAWSERTVSQAQVSSTRGMRRNERGEWVMCASREGRVGYVCIKGESGLCVHQGGEWVMCASRGGVRVRVWM